MISGKDGKATGQVLVATAAAAATVAAAFLLHRQTKGTAKKKKLQRSWSFTSEGMRLGIFPSHIKAPATIINAALYFEKGCCPTVEALCDQVVKPLLQYDRFANVPADDGSTPFEYAANAASDLVRSIEIDGDEGTLHSTIYKLLSDPLGGKNKDKPLWELVRIVNVSGRSVLLLRVHHCLGDGLSLVNVFDKIIQTEKGTPAQSKVTRALMNRQYEQPSLTSILSAIFHVLTLGATKFDDKTAVFNDSLTYSGNRTVVLFPNVPLSYIKQCKAQAPFDTTINDILMCAVSQAVHDYCLHQQDPVLKAKGKNLQCRALLPVSLPRSNHNDKPLQNRFCMVSSDLCVGPSNLVERLQAIHTTTTMLKQSPRAFVQLWMQNHVVSKLPHSIARQTAHDIFSRHSLVLTNIPGPEEVFWLANQRVTGLQLFFPNVIPQFDLLTYAGVVHGNVIYDPNDWKDGEVMASLYAKALVDLGTEFGVQDIPSDLQKAAANPHV